jgi:deazaflavin-dependent oxidoreductase (nitroreductase family)
MTLSPDDLDRLATFTTIDITTIGRTSGKPRRVEIWWFRVDGRFIVSGTPGRRDWLANVIANPSLVVHVNGFDLSAKAAVITDGGFRRRFFTRPETSWYSTQTQLELLINTAPMIEVLF